MNIRKSILTLAAFGAFCAAPVQAQWATIKASSRPTLPQHRPLN